MRGAKRRSNLIIAFYEIATQSFGLLAMTHSVEIAAAISWPRNDFPLPHD
jgi:hypothetical protein